MSQLAHLGRFVASLRYDSIPDSTRTAARMQLLDMLAAVFAARGSQEAEAVLRGALAATAGASGHSTLLSTAQKAPLGTAAAVNAAYAMAHDFDDIIWTGHTCHSAVFASLAAAEHLGRPSQELLTAIVAANEVSGRLAASSILGPLNGQMTTYLHLIGAAAATAKLLRLDAERTTHALAIALAQPNYALQPAFLRPSSKLLSAAVPIQTGIDAAFYAEAGLQGEPTLLEDPRGFWKTFAFIPLPAALGDLGSFWALETLTLKTYPGCHYFQTACSALDELLARNQRDAILSIDVETNKMCIEVSRFGAAYAGQTLSPVNVNFDLATTLAVLLHARRLTTAELDTNWLAENREALLGWRERIIIRHAPELTLRVLVHARGVAAGRTALRSLGVRDVWRLRQRYADTYRSSLLSLGEAAAWAKALCTESFAPPFGPVRLAFPSRVTLHLKNGQKDRAELDVPVGAFALPSALPALRKKFLHASYGQGEEVFADGLKLEQHDLAEWLLRAVAIPKSPNVRPH